MPADERTGVILEVDEDYFVFNAIDNDHYLGSELDYVSPGFVVEEIPDCVDVEKDYMLKPVGVGGGLYPEGENPVIPYRVLRIGPETETEKELGQAFFVYHPYHPGRNGIFSLESAEILEDREFFSGRDSRAVISEDYYPVTETLQKPASSGQDKILKELSRALEDSEQLNAVNQILNGETHPEETNIAGQRIESGDRKNIEGNVNRWQIDDQTSFFNGYIGVERDGSLDTVTGIVQDGELGMIRTPESRIGTDKFYFLKEMESGRYEGEWVSMENPDQIDGEAWIGIGPEPGNHKLSEFTA